MNELSLPNVSLQLTRRKWCSTYDAPMTRTKDGLHVLKAFALSSVETLSASVITCFPANLEWKTIRADLILVKSGLIVKRFMFGYIHLK
jgi:hypothetical protein